jgi:hypothetical protein
MILFAWIFKRALNCRGAEFACAELSLRWNVGAELSCAELVALNWRATRKLIKWKIVLRIIRNLDAKYSELDEYNQEFWSKYLLSIWLIAGFFINFSLYHSFFSEMTVILKLMSGYFTAFTFQAFLFIITNVSSVNYEANKMYKLLNQIMVYNSSSRLRFSTRNNSIIAYSTKIKVKN